jgi:hypothetical protein
MQEQGYYGYYMKFCTVNILENTPEYKFIFVSSAADLYITKHFDDFRRRHPQIAIRRVYAKERRVNTVQPVVRHRSVLITCNNVLGL